VRNTSKEINTLSDGQVGNPGNPAQNQGSKRALIPFFLYGVVTIAIVGIIGWGLRDQDGFLTSLANKEVARGLITFLIAITTVGIAVILAISTIFGADGAAEDKRFDRGKQVLTTLIGILGTIVGFYYGAATDAKSDQVATNSPPQQSLTIAPARISNEQPKKGEKAIISSFVMGGKPPFTYSITFDPAILDIIKDKPSSDGVIKEEVAIPATLEADKDVKFKIFVKDNEGKTFEYNKEGTQKIAAKSK